MRDVIVIGAGGPPIGRRCISQLLAERESMYVKVPVAPAEYLYTHCTKRGPRRERTYLVKKY